MLRLNCILYRGYSPKYYSLENGFRMDKVLVTGADGFIGSHLVEELVRRNFRVKAFVLYNSYGSLGWLDHIDKEIRENLEIFVGDIRIQNARKIQLDNAILFCTWPL